MPYLYSMPLTSWPIFLQSLAIFCIVLRVLNINLRFSAILGVFDRVICRCLINSSLVALNLAMSSRSSLSKSCCLIASRFDEATIPSNTFNSSMKFELKNSNNSIQILRPYQRSVVAQLPVISVAFLHHLQSGKGRIHFGLHFRCIFDCVV